MDAEHDRDRDHREDAEGGGEAVEVAVGIVDREATGCYSFMRSARRYS